MRRLALFDLDDTLIDRSDAFAAWVEEFVTAYGLDDGWVTRLLVADAKHSGPMDRYFASVREQLDLPEAADQLWRRYRRRMPELATCRAENLEALRALRSAGWRIGIVTNGMTDNQLGKIHNSGLAAVVDAWCISEEIGICKPDPRIFRLAAERCGVPADRGGWMVGDRLGLDIAGGRAAGLRTIWVRPPPGRRAEEPQSPGGPTPDRTVASVPEAVATLLDAR